MKTAGASAATRTDIMGDLRPMGIDDLDAVLAIEVGAYSHPWTRGNFLDSLSAGHDVQVLLDGERSIVAYAVVMEGVDEEHVLNLTVDRERQRCGWGRSLLQTVVARARSRHAQALWLEVRASNAPARALYRQAGFMETGFRRAYYPAAAGREDAVLMSLSLKGSPGAGEPR